MEKTRLLVLHSTAYDGERQKNGSAATQIVNHYYNDRRNNATNNYATSINNTVNQQWQTIESVDSGKSGQNDEDNMFIMPEEQVHKHNLRVRRFVIKDLLVLSVSFCLVYMAFVALQTLQSSLNSHEGLGVASLCWIYSASVVSCLVAPLLMKYFTTKWTILVGFSCFLLYLLTNFYPMYFIILPASLIFGLTFGPMWSAQSTHLTTLAIRYGNAKMTVDNYENVYFDIADSSTRSNTEVRQTKNKMSSTCPTMLNSTPLHPHEGTITMFNAIFWSIFQTCHLWGNMLSSSFLLHSTNSSSYMTRSLINYTRLYCGARNCASYVYGFKINEEQLYRKSLMSLGYKNQTILDEMIPHHLHPVPDDTRHLLLTLYVVCVLAGVLVLSWKLDKLQIYSSGSKASANFRQLLLDTVRMFGDVKLQLLVPLMIFVGLQQAFIQGDFTKVSANDGV